MGRFSNSNSVGPGYLSLGLSGGGPDELFWSYSAATYGGCGGTFIGPNVLLTAGHCGHSGFDGEPPIIFGVRFYPLGGQTAPSNIVNGFCETLVQNIGFGDTQLAYCDDINWGGVWTPPGEIAGIADFDRASLSVGTQLWSAWPNNECPNTPDPDKCDGPAHQVFGRGAVTSIDPLGPLGAVTVLTNQIFAVGGSGSALWRPVAGSLHRITTSGVAQAVCDQGTPGCGGPIVALLSSALDVAKPATDGTGINVAKLQSIGLMGPSTPWPNDDYTGLMDADKNGYFDVQERLDQVRGITFRPTVWLGFESPRRNRLWQTLPAANVIFADTNLQAVVNFDGGPDTVLMRLRKVALSPNQRYRVSIMVHTAEASGEEELRLELVDPVSGTKSQFPIETDKTSPHFRMIAGTMMSQPVVNHELRLVSVGGRFKGSLVALTLIRDGSVHTFDWQDERTNWRDNTTGARSWILPYGRPITTPVGNRETSWAGLVHDSSPAAVDWALRNRQLGISPGATYRVCFDVRSLLENVLSGTGRIQLGQGAEGGPDPGQVGTPWLYFDQTFLFTNAWTSTCIPSVGGIQVSNGDNLLQFGHTQGQPAYLIDNIRVEAL